jgi:integrase
MIVRFSPRPEDLQRLQVGPIGPHLPSFATLVAQQGYCSVTGWLKVRLVAKLSRWLQQYRVPLSELNETQIATFFNARWRRLKQHVGDQTTMALLLRHLRQANVVASPPEAGTGSDTDLLCAEYEGFLLRERSLMPSSSENYIDVARRFLFERFPTGKIYLKKLRAGDVTDFILHDSSNRGRRSVQLTATVLRSFLNFLFQKGRSTTNLAAAVPSVPHRHLAELPHYLEAREVERVLRSCDRRRKIGKRDYAIFLLLALLGLRAGEVAQLTLDDIDWRAGELLVRGKGARVDRLPLLQDVGQALAEYLQKARPACSSRRVFHSMQSPFRGLRRSSVCQQSRSNGADPP